MDQPDRAEDLAAYPLVSVAIPCYNSASTISETLEGVFGQTYPNIEVVVVDDGSTDDTLAELERYHQRVRVIPKPNGGLASARNAGCQAARGKYIALLDADDLCMPERLAVQVAYMERNPDVVLCSSELVAFDQEGVRPDTTLAAYYSQVRETSGGVAGIYPRHEELCLAGHAVSTYSGNVYESMATGSFIHPPTVLFRRTLLERCGLWDEHIANATDFDWLVRMSRLGEIGFIDRPLLKYRCSESQMSGSRNRSRIALDIVLIIEKTLATDPELFRRRRTLFRQHLGQGYLDAATTLVDDRPIEGMRMLIRSATFGFWSRQSLKVLAKAFIPMRVLQWKRSRVSR